MWKQFKSVFRLKNTTNFILTFCFLHGLETIFSFKTETMLEQQRPQKFVYETSSLNNKTQCSGNKKNKKLSHRANVANPTGKKLILNEILITFHPLNIFLKSLKHA